MMSRRQPCPICKEELKKSNLMVHVSGHLFVDTTTGQIMLTGVSEPVEGMADVTTVTLIPFDNNLLFPGDFQHLCSVCNRKFLHHSTLDDHRNLGCAGMAEHRSSGPDSADYLASVLSGMSQRELRKRLLELFYLDQVSGVVMSRVLCSPRTAHQFGHSAPLVGDGGALTLPDARPLTSQEMDPGQFKYKCRSCRTGFLYLDVVAAHVKEVHLGLKVADE